VYGGTRDADMVAGSFELARLLIERAAKCYLSIRSILPPPEKK
jgi:hypothetical protein